MNPNEQLIQNFYQAFDRKDYKTMNACYHTQAEFSDPVFTDLKGKKQVSAMWHMLCEAAKDMQIKCTGVSADDKTGTATWEAIYTFSSTGRKVHNKVKSYYEFKDGLIIKQKDEFDLHRWASMALGAMGTFFGWLPAIKNKIRGKVSSNMYDFVKKHPEYQ